MNSVICETKPKGGGWIGMAYIPNGERRDSQIYCKRIFDTREKALQDIKDCLEQIKAIDPCSLGPI